MYALLSNKKTQKKYLNFTHLMMISVDIKLESSSS